MPNQYMSQLRKKTVDRLADHGLELLLEYDTDNGKDGANSALPESRTSNESTWVGIDVAGSPLSDPTKTIEHLVVDYCSKILNCKTTDIIWCLVEQYEDNGTRYRIINASGCWGSDKYSLIYMVKTDVLALYDIDMISHCFEKDLRNIMREQATEYTAWLNNEVLKAFVSAKQKIINTPLDTSSATQSCIMPVTDEVDVYSNEAIDALIYSINNSGKSSVDLSLFTDRDMPSYVNKQLYFIRTMEHVFGFTPVLGACEFDVPNRIFNIRLSLDCLPPLSVLKASTITKVRDESDFSLISSLKNHLAWLIDNEIFELLSPWQVIDVLSEDKPYSEWPPILLNALMLTLCSPIGVMRLEEISMHVSGDDAISHDDLLVSKFN